MLQIVQTEGNASGRTSAVPRDMSVQRYRTTVKVISSTRARPAKPADAHKVSEDRVELDVPAEHEALDVAVVGVVPDTGQTRLGYPSTSLGVEQPRSPSRRERYFVDTQVADSSGRPPSGAATRWSGSGPPYAPGRSYRDSRPPATRSRGSTARARRRRRSRPRSSPTNLDASSQPAGRSTGVERPKSQTRPNTIGSSVLRIRSRASAARSTPARVVGAARGSPGAATLTGIAQTNFHGLLPGTEPNKPGVDHQSHAIP